MVDGDSGDGFVVRYSDFHGVVRGGSVEDGVLGKKGSEVKHEGSLSAGKSELRLWRAFTCKLAARSSDEDAHKILWVHVACFH